MELAIRTLETKINELEKEKEVISYRIINGAGSNLIMNKSHLEVIESEIKEYEKAIEKLKS